MSYKNYNEYVDSGIEWIGKIPKHWYSCKLKHVINEFVAGGTPKSSNDKFWDEHNAGIPWVAIGDMYDNEYINTTSKSLTIEGLTSKNLRILKKGTLIYSIFASLGKVSILNINATTNQAILGLIISNKIDNYYLKYCLKALQSILPSFSNENTQENLNATIVKNMEIAMPKSLDEQKQISVYLNHQLLKINNVIEKNKKLIDLLEEKKVTLINQAVTKGLDSNVQMKDSSIEWVGEIPIHWEVLKLKQVCNVLGRIGFRGYKASDLVSKGEGAYTIGAKHIQNNKLDLSNPEYLSWEKYYESPEIMVQVGDLLITQRGAKLGKIALIEEDISPATINPSLIILKNIQCEGKFLYYLLCSHYILKTIELINSHTAVPMISQEQVNNFTIFKPPLGEQEQIIKYLDERISEIDEIIIKINENISLLEEYKNSLIYNVVTGKVDVRGEEI